MRMFHWDPQVCLFLTPPSPTPCSPTLLLFLIALSYFPPHSTFHYLSIKPVAIGSGILDSCRSVYFEVYLHFVPAPSYFPSISSTTFKVSSKACGGDLRHCSISTKLICNRYPPLCYLLASNLPTHLPPLGYQVRRTYH